MNRPLTKQHRALLEGLQRLGTALQDMLDELPSQQQAVLVSPIQDAAPVLDVLEHQLMWLVDDMARLRAANLSGAAHE